MGKKLLSLILCFSLWILLLPMAVFSEGEDIASGTGWVIDSEGCLHITGVIDYNSLSGSPWKSNADKIESVVAESGASIKTGYGLFDSCLNMKSADLSELDTSAVTSMSYMFNSCSSLKELDLSGFNTENVMYMEAMFQFCSNLEELDLSGFNTGKVRNMDSMFYRCSSLKTLDLSGFDTSSVDNMYVMFNGCSSLEELDLSSFNTEKVKTMYGMFYGCKMLKTLDVTSFNTSAVENMAGMFNGCSSLEELDLKNFDTSKAKLTYFLANCTSLKSVDVSGFDVSNATSLEAMFYNCNALKSLDVSNWDTSNVTDMSFVFADCNALAELDVSGWNTAKATTMKCMFNDCNALPSLDVSGFNTSKATDIFGMFYGCKLLTELDVSSWDTSKVTDMEGVFNGCVNVTELDVSNWDTSNVTTLYCIFNDCSSVTELDVSNWDTSKVENMAYMFYNCKEIENLDVSSFDTSKVTDMTEMFCKCRKIKNFDLDNFDTSNTKTMCAMFYGCSSLTDCDLSSFDTSKVTDVSWMFYDCGSLAKLDLSVFDLNKVEDAKHIFEESPALVEFVTNDSVRNKLSDQFMTVSPKWFNKDDGTLYSDESALKGITGAATLVRGRVITFDPNGGTVATASAVTDMGGKLDSLPIPTRAGKYSFKGWFTAASGGEAVTEGAVFMKDTTLYANWLYSGGGSSSGGGSGASTNYTLTFNTNGGSAISSVSGVSGKVISLGKYVTVRDGYTFGGWYLDKGLTSAVSEVKMNGNVTVYAKWTAKDINIDNSKFVFTDIAPTDWSYGDIYYVWQKGLMKGTSDTFFNPQGETSRAMIATVIWRMEGEPAARYNVSFSDVKGDSWYVQAISWAQANGIVKGYSAEQFGPEDLITREQMAAMFCRYAAFKGYDVSARTNLSGFADANMIGDWAKDNMAWANAKGLVKGVTATKLDPQGLMTREQAAAFLHRFDENVSK